MDIKELRKSKGYTQEEIARKLKISLRHYISIEQRKVKPNVTIGLKLCKILNVDPYKVFYK